MARAGVTVEWDDKGFKKLLENLKELAKLKATVGYQGRDATMKVPGSKATLSEIAKWNEYGTSTIPARPFMRRAAKKNGKAIAEVAAVEFGGVAESGDDPVSAMAEVGKVLLDGLHAQLDSSQSWARPNAPSTIKKKGFGLAPLDGGGDWFTKNSSWAVRENRKVIKDGKS